MERDLRAERGVCKVFDVFSDEGNLRDPVAELVHDLVRNQLDDCGRGSMIGMCQRCREQEVVSLDWFSDAGDDLLSQVFQQLLAHAAHGGHALLAEVGDLGRGEAHDAAYGDLSLTARLLAVVHVYQVPRCQGNCLHLQYNEQSVCMKIVIPIVNSSTYNMYMAIHAFTACVQVCMA